MTSSGPYTQSYNFTYEWEPEYTKSLQNQIKVSKKESETDTNSFYGFIQGDSQYKDYNYIIQKAGLQNILHTLKNHTIFLPIKINNLNNIDRGKAIQIFKATTVKGIIPSFLLRQTKVQYIPTLDRSNPLKVQVSDQNEIYLRNNPVKLPVFDQDENSHSLRKVIKADIKVDSLLIHIIDGEIDINKYTI